MRHAIQPLHLSRLAPAALLFLSSALGARAANAGELEVHYSSNPGNVTGALTYLDVVAGPLPALEVKSASGQVFRVDLDVQPRDGDAVHVAAKVYEVSQKRGAQRVKLLAEGTIQTTDGAPGSLAFTHGRGSGGGQVEIELTPRLAAVHTMAPVLEDLKSSEQLQAELAGAAAKEPTAAKELAGSEGEGAATEDDVGEAVKASTERAP